MHPKSWTKNFWGALQFLFGVIEITFGEMLVLLLLNHDPELCSSSFTFGSENKLSLHSLNHDLLAIYDIYALLGHGLANTIQVVNRSILGLCILNSFDSRRISFNNALKVLPRVSYLVCINSACWYMKGSIFDIGIFKGICSSAGYIFCITSYIGKFWA